jgi:hypothetical protein
VDPELRPRDLAVYVFLHAQLDYLTYRIIKIRWLSRVMRLDKTYLSRAIHRLVERGYLEPMGSTGSGAPSHYRIPYSPGRGVVTLPDTSPPGPTLAGSGPASEVLS